MCASYHSHNHLANLKFTASKSQKAELSNFLKHRQKLISHLFVIQGQGRAEIENWLKTID